MWVAIYIPYLHADGCTYRRVTVAVDVGKAGAGFSHIISI